MRFLILAPMLISSLAMAQASPSKPKTVAVVAPPPTRLVPPSGNQLDRVAEIPDREKVRRSTEALTQMRVTLRDLVSKLDRARGTKDVVKLNCVNEKVTQVKGLVRISDQADGALQDAVSHKVASVAEHEYTKVMIARQKSEILNSEAEECIGQLASRTDERQEVIVEEPAGLPTDPTRATAPLDVYVRPPPSSPSQ